MEEEIKSFPSEGVKTEASHVGDNGGSVLLCIRDVATVLSYNEARDLHRSLCCILGNGDVKIQN